jgi:Cytochrome C oxidase, cbb3-type, subunit III
MRFHLRVGFLALSVSMAFGLMFGLWYLTRAHAQTEPTPYPMPAMPTVQDRLAPPPTVYPPTQADQGAQVYYQVCMACHGDHGQGLTDEWRQVLDVPDQNCWQSKCHAANHPPDGFVFPKYVTPVIAPGLLTRFATAMDLYDFIKKEMPFQAPGSLMDDQYWQLTAFLIRANGYDIGSQNLDTKSATRIALRPYPLSKPTLFQRLGQISPWVWGAVIMVGIGIVLSLFLIRLHRT